MNTADLIEQLGIGDYPEEEQQAILADLNHRIGEELAKGLDEQQLNEYQAIIDGNQDVINAWLEQNLPNYKDLPIYEEIESQDVDDPERVPADKVIASIAWVQKNSPNAQEVSQQKIEEIKAELVSKQAA